MVWTCHGHRSTSENHLYEIWHHDQKSPPVQSLRVGNDLYTHESKESYEPNTISKEETTNPLAKEESTDVNTEPDNKKET